MFRKYPEIKNLYRSKKIDQFLEYNPYAQDSSYIYQVKYDGANIQLIFEPDKEIKIAKRPDLIDDDQNFYGILDIIDRYIDLIDYFQDYCDVSYNHVNLYGEIFGHGIQKRIDYGPDKYLKFYDIAINYEMLNYLEAKEKFTYLIDHYYVETYGPVLYNKIFNLEIPENHEGIVIKPYEMVDRNERQLILKSKNEKFSEKGKAKKLKKESDPIVEEMKGNFLQYINENRVKSIFSQKGEIEDEEQIGEYIRLVIEDAIDDFEKDKDINHLTKNQFKQVKKTGFKEIVSILRKYL